MARKRPESLRSRLDTEVLIQAPPDADDATLQDAAGEVDASEANWSQVARVWAEILPESGGEIIIGGQASGAQRYRVTTRRGVTIELTHRIKVLHGILSGKFLYVEAAARADRDEELAVICRQGVRP